MELVPVFTCSRNTLCRIRRGVSCLVIALAMFGGPPGLAWNPPPPSNPDAPSGSQMSKIADHGSKKYGYYVSPHGYILDHAMAILAADNRQNWAELAKQYEKDMLDGAMFADRAGPDLTLRVYVWTLIPWPMRFEAWSKRLCNYASLEHYHNPDTGKGLQLVYYKQLEDWASEFAPLISWFAGTLVGSGGLVFGQTEISPEIQPQYRSAAEVCEEHYQLAVACATNKAPQEGIRTQTQTAMFHLG